MPAKHDLHEHQCLVQDLDECDHLKRITCLCTVHVYRNIQKCKVSDAVKDKMRSLVCLQHPSWDQTVAEIRSEGRKAGRDWMDDKIRSKFALPALCWERSFFPLLIWQLGEDTTNLIESLHFDVNQEGVGCSLIGGVLKGYRFDILKEKMLKSFEISRSLKRKATSKHKSLQVQDNRIEHTNKRLRTAEAVMVEKQGQYNLALSSLPSQSPSAIEKARRRAERASGAYSQAVSASMSIIGTGSGKAALLLPSDVAESQQQV
ncbi:hypothetical protein BKA70DRAFT_1442199 [Coprinopsis sp. MPI-PUGE-AT-0042]|nr:hypothetical protein BKA70DRAFT_1442199 [Coprinopsis sp. MPI-PUGE-AT-0042]